MAISEKEIAIRPLTKSMSVVIFLQKVFKKQVKYGIIKA